MLSHLNPTAYLYYNNDAPLHVQTADEGSGST